MRPCIKPLGVLSRHPCRIPKPLSPVKGCVCLVGFASLQSPLAYTPGIHAGAERGATAPSPSKDACSQPHKATMQGRIMTATQSRCTMQRHKWLSMHNATAQMAVNAQMQWYKWLTTCTGALPQSKDACSQPHKATMQGRIMTATQSHCTMQRHKWLSMHRCNGTNS